MGLVVEVAVCVVDADGHMGFLGCLVVVVDAVFGVVVEDCHAGKGMAFDAVGHAAGPGLVEVLDVDGEIVDVVGCAVVEGGDVVEAVAVEIVEDVDGCGAGWG